ncbi:MAG TPA: phosphatase PAP2 family protein [Thermoleophilia bacterium]|nr:phosphatase PAP2 family protein [Thermoleophilia bacterium]
MDVGRGRREMKSAVREWRNILPNGRGDAIRQLLILLSSYIAYDLVRFLTTGRESTAMANANHIIAFERSLGLYLEPWIQARISHFHELLLASNWFYAQVHIPSIVAFLAWVYLRRNDAFAFFRNAFLLINAIALSVFALVPVAPPRLLPNSGIVDTLYVFSRISYESGGLQSITNPFAALPSLHFGYAVFISVGLLLLVRSRWARLAALVYPVMVLAAIVATGNHFLLDALAGGLVIAVAYLFTLSGASEPEVAHVRLRVGRHG